MAGQNHKEKQSPMILSGHDSVAGSWVAAAALECNKSESGFSGKIFSPPVCEKKHFGRGMRGKGMGRRVRGFLIPLPHIPLPLSFLRFTSRLGCGCRAGLLALFRGSFIGLPPADFLAFCQYNVLSGIWSHSEKTATACSRKMACMGSLRAESGRANSS